ncbi:MAG: hypothetical protein B6I29_04625 [Marinitoga sp. 4572_148]|nr:MAG: hypothetical protein B6I29_04625 [Marinitoga sp. 4572_148]
MFVGDPSEESALINEAIREIFVLVNHNYSNRQIMAFLITNGFKINIFKIESLFNRFRDIVPKWDFKGYSK